MVGFEVRSRIEKSTDDRSPFCVESEVDGFLVVVLDDVLGFTVKSE